MPSEALVTFDKCGYCQVKRGEYHKPICVIYRIGNGKGYDHSGPIKFESDLSMAGIAPIPLWPERAKPPKAPEIPNGSPLCDIQWVLDMTAWAKEVEQWLSQHS